MSEQNIIRLAIIAAATIVVVVAGWVATSAVGFGADNRRWWSAIAGCIVAVVMVLAAFQLYSSNSYWSY